MASKNSDKDQKKDTIIPNNCQITETIDLISSDESDEDVKYLGKIPMKISSNVSQDLENTKNQEENISIRYSEKITAEMNINGIENIYKEPCRKRKTRDTDGQVSFNKERAVFNLAIKKRKGINSVLSSESTDTEERLNESGECVKSNSSTSDMETERILEFTPPCRNIKKRKFHTSLNVKKQKQSCAYRSNRELDGTNSLLVSSKRPVVVINNLNVGLSRMTKENREHSINTKIPKAKNVEIIDLDPVSRNTPFSESDKNNSACKLEFPNVDKTELKRILETVNNLHSDNALHDCDKSYKDKLFPTEREDSDQSAESSIPINNFTFETKIENCYTSDVSTNVSSLTLNNITIKTDKENIDSVDVTTKVSLLTFNDATKTENENCESSDAPRNLPALTINNAAIKMERENFEPDNVSINASPLTSNNVSHSSYLTRLEMQEVLKRIYETSKESFSDKTLDGQNTSYKSELKNFQNLLGQEAIRNSTAEEKPTDIKLEEETRSHALLCNPTEKTFLTDKIPTKTFRKSENSIPINNLTLETKIENCDSFDVSTNVSPLTLNNVTNKTDKENFYPVDVPTKVSISELNDIIKTEKENYESSFVQRNVSVLTIHNGTIEEESEIFESENVTMNASPLTSKKFSDLSSLTKLEIQQVLKRINETSKESSADKNADRKNANNKNEIENFQNLLEPENAIKNSTDEEKPTDMELEKETMSHGFLCNPTKTSFVIVKIPTKFLRTAESDTIKTEKENCESSFVQRNVPVLTIHNGTIEEESENFESENVTMNASPLTSKKVSDSSSLTKLEIQQVLKRIDETSKESSADKNSDRKIATNKNEIENLQNLLGPEDAVRNSTDEEKPTDIELEKETRSHGFLCNPTKKSCLIVKIPTKFLRTTESAIPINHLTLKTKLENIDSFNLSTNVDITPLTLNNVTINTDKENFNAVDVSTKASLLMLSDTTKTDKENWESSDIPRNVSALTLNNGTIDKESEIFEYDNVSMNAFSLTSNNVSHSSRLTKLDMQEILKRIDKTSEESSTDKNAVNKLEMENLQNLLGPDEEIRNSTSAEKNPPDMKLEKETRSYGLEKTFLIDKIPKEKITENNPKLLNIEREEFPTKSLGINGNFSKHFTHRNANNPPLPSSTIYSPNNNMLIANRHLNYASLGNCMSETISDLNYFSKSSESCINSENILNQCYSKSSDSCINNEKVSNQFLCCPKSTHLSFYPLHSCVDPEIKTSSLCHNPASEMEDYVSSSFGDLSCSKSTSISCSSDTTLKLQPGIRSCFPLPESISFLNSLSSQTLQNEATNVPYEKCYLNIYTQSPMFTRGPSLAPSNSAPSLGSSVYSSENFQKIPSLVPFYLKSLIGKGNISRDDFLLLILEWNADWLTDLLENQDPPLIAHDLRTIFNSYEYYEDYYNTLFPLMMLETWHRIYATSSDFKQNPPLLGKIDEYSVKKHCTEVKCKAVYKPGMIFPDVGKIIVVRYVLKSKAQAIKVFGYVTEVKSKPIKPVTDSVFIEFLTKKTGMILDPHLMIFLTFKAVYHSEDINKDLPLYIQVLCSIDFNLKQNDALLFMKSCPLQRSILDPTANGFLRFSLSGKHSSEDDVKECVRNILKNILSPNPAPIIAVRTDNVFGHSKVVPFLVQAIRNDCKKMKILICVRHPQTLGKIAHSLSLLKNLEFVIFNKRADTSSKFHKFTLDKIAESKEEKIKEIEGDQKINNEMILKIKKDILLSSDVVLSLVKCSHDKFLAETILEIKSIHEICCIIDEANYCTEPETLIPMLLEIGQLILVGDLGEKAKVLSKTARDYNFNQSFFERAYVIDLINTYKQTRQDCIL